MTKGIDKEIKRSLRRSSGFWSTQTNREKEHLRSESVWHTPDKTPKPKRHWHKGNPNRCKKSDVTLPAIPPVKSK